MAVLKLYDKTFQWAVEADSYEDSNGDIIIGSPSWSDGIKCEIAHSGGNATITHYEDGKQIGYSHVVYLKPDAPDFYYGQHVRVVKDGMILVESDVKGFMRYQLQCKIWL